MVQFLYKARDEQGSLHQNVVIAESIDLARSQLSEKGLWVIEIEESKKHKKAVMDIELDGFFSELMGVGLKDLVIFCRQFSTLINAGVAMMRSLNILALQTENPKLAKILKLVKDDVEQGESLSAAFGKHPTIFDRLFVSMIKAGETGGVLDEVMNRIALFMENRAKLSAKIKSAMAYPAVVSIFAIIIFFVMLTVILPKFSEIFSKLGSELPAYTQFLIHISEFLRSPAAFLLIISLGAVGYGFKKIYSLERGKYFFDKLFLGIPIIGSLLQKVAVARFSRTFGTLIKSGVPILTSLDIVEDSSGNAVLAKSVREIREEVKQGGMIHKPLENSEIFPPMVTSMIAVGEETGELDLMLSKIADFYDAEVESAVDSLTAILEPIMMVFLGGMVGAVIVGMYLPMFKIFDAIH
ncbi:MAG: pilus assembly protein PilC [Candidatus Melainabacteria bacterium GWA2_34_9]|nr:MAG: pilus assembly protein PilC [Candidatus Melainabacteria bacterium GWA2_34_9]